MQFYGAIFIYVVQKAPVLLDAAEYNVLYREIVKATFNACKGKHS
jgi:hypothetical protein